MAETATVTEQLTHTDNQTPGENPKDRAKTAASAARREYNAVVRRARFAEFWEKSMPKFLPSAGLTTVFLSTAASGAWGMLPVEGRMVGLAAFGVGLLLSLTPLRHVRIPTRKDAVARIDANTGKKHRPAETLISGEPADAEPGSSKWKLWEAHIQQTRESIGELRAGKPQPKLAEKDPYNLRFVPLLFALAGAITGGVDALDNMKQPFDFTRPPPIIIPARVDAWITPPDYTRIAPIFLTIDGQVRRETPVGDTLDLPAGSTMTIRVSGGPADVTVSGGTQIESAPPAPVNADGETDPNATPDPTMVQEYELSIGDSGGVNINAYGDVKLNWTFEVLPDRAPTIDLSAQPGTRRPRTTELNYTVNDDYDGVELTPTLENGEETPSTSERAPRPLIPPPTINLPLNRAPR